MKAYHLYLEQSSIKRPLLIADLKEEYIDSLLQQEGISAIKPHLYFPGYIANRDLATLYNAAFAFSILRFVKASVFQYWKQWHVVSR